MNHKSNGFIGIKLLLAVAILALGYFIFKGLLSSGVPGSAEQAEQIKTEASQ